MYCTHLDLLNIVSKNELLDLVNDENYPYNGIDLEDVNSLCRQRIDDAVNAADAEIDGYLRQCTEVPLVGETPVLVKIISRSLTLEYLYRRRISGNIPETVRDDTRLKRSMLKDIAEGIIFIASESSAPELYKSNKSNSDRSFPDDTLEKY